MYKELVRLLGRALFLLLLAVMPAEAGAFRLIWTQEATIADILAAFKAKELTCRQLVQMYLDRIEAYDRKGPALNAIIMVNPNALATADALDAKFAQSGLAGPLHCVPVIVKDNYETVDMPTSAGSLSLEGVDPAARCFPGAQAARGRRARAGQIEHGGIRVVALRDGGLAGARLHPQPLRARSRPRRLQRRHCGGGGGELRGGGPRD